MFYRKLIALLLLGFYGIPAALGPHWHHHGCTEPACVSQHDNASASVVEAPKTSHQCSCHHHGPLKAAKQANKPLAWTEACDQHDGPCAICAFYASAQDLTLVFEFASQHELVSIIELLEPAAPSTSLSIAQARGPPSFTC